MRERVDDFFQSFDMFAAPASLRAKGSSSITRTSAGVISFILFCYFAYIFITGIYNIFSYNSIISSQTFKKIPLTQIYAQNFMFGIGNINIDPQFRDTQFDITTTIKSNKGGVIQNITMIPCTPDQWKKLGDDYQNQFKLHYLDKFVCPEQPEKLKLINSTLIENAVYFQIIIQPKNDSFSKQASLKISQLEILQANKFSLFYLDQAIIPNQQEAVQYFVNIDHFVLVSQRKFHKTLIRLSNFNVVTDYSVLPIITSKQQIKGSFVADAVISDLDSNSQLQNSKIYFQLTNDLIIYNRKVGKIDEMFSYAGGLFALSIWILAFFVASFNQHRYQLMVAQTVFNYDADGHKVSQNSFGFGTYIKYSIFKWSQSYLCYKPKWQNCHKIQKTLIQARHQMDVTRLFRKLQFLQMALIHSSNESQNLIVALAQPRSLAQVKEQRMILQYYFYIIKGEPAATVGDARDGNARRFHNLTKSPQNFTTEQQLSNSQNLNQPLLSLPNEEIKQKLMQYLELKQYQYICVAISKYPFALEQAKSVVLPPELQLVEQHMTQHFLKLRPFVKIKVMNKIPLKIIHRLCLKSQQMKKKKNIQQQMMQNKQDDILKADE